jgi:heme/copper-type cytochrome/quinol oxidase subunit 2
MSLQKLERFRWFIIGFFTAIMIEIFIVVFVLLFYV